jgi:hypothetical protein
MTDRNEIFDNSALFPFDPREFQQVEKGATMYQDDEPENAIFDGVFPSRQLAQKSMSGAEAMNRVTHPEKDQATGAPKTGRPPKKGTPLDYFDPKNPRSVLGIQGDKLQAGSVLHVEFKDGRRAFVVLLADTPFDILPDATG